jgi:hypothetical protein
MKINGATVLSALATTTNYVLKQSSTVGTLINSQIFDNGTNVGIGTTSPSAKLDVNGSAYIAGTITLPQNPTGTTYGNGVSASPPYMINQGAGDNDAIRFYAESAATNQVSMVFEINDDIETAGNEWIWRNKKTYGGYEATTPMLLSGAGAATFLSSVTATQYNILNSNQTIGIANTSDIQINAAVASSNILFRVSGDERMRITSSGNVGIGTTTPFQSKVHILKSESGSNPIPVLRIGNQGAGYTSRIVLTDETTNDANISYIGSLQSLGFGVGASLSQMIITSSGNVGIGTTSPGNLLNTFIANGAGDFGKGVRISTGNGTYTSGHGGMLEFQNEDVMTAGIRGVRQSGWGSSLLFYVHNTSAGNTFDSTFVERMRIDESGNVGIGTTSPSSNLTVVRNANNASYITTFSNTNSGASAATISEWKVNGYSSFVIGKSNSDGRVEIAQIGNNNIDFINNGTNVMSIDTNQNVMVNGTTAEACAQLEIKSETKGFLPPRMSDADRDNISSPVEGLMIYNTTQKTINFYDGTTWQRVAVV